MQTATGSRTPVADLIQPGETVTYNTLRDRMISARADLGGFTLYEELKAEVRAGFIQEIVRRGGLVYRKQS